VTEASTARRAGSITVGEFGNEIGVQTYDAGAAPRDSGFHLIVVCS